MNELPDMDRLGQYFATNEEYIRKYRFTNAFHPFHGFSMMSCGHIAEMNTSAIYIVGAQEPGIARGMGLKTRATFEEALQDAMKKYVGPNPRILALPADEPNAEADENAAKAASTPVLWCAGVDTGAYQAVNCRLRRPEVFGGAIGLSGLYDMSRFLGSAEDDLVLRNAPLAYLTETGLVDKKAFAKAEENDLILCAGQGSYEEEAQADTRALSEALTAAGLPAHCEFWGSDVSHDWYWWGKELHLFAERIFGEGGSHA